MQAALLSNRGVVRVSGPDAAGWLQGLITNDVGLADDENACFAAMLTPQGKILFDFLIHRRNDDFLLDCAADQAAALARRLSMYRLRAKVEVADASGEFAVYAVWETASAPAPDARRDPRHSELGWRVLAAKSGAPIKTNAGKADFAAHRICLGVPEGGSDFAFGEHFPHDVNMDEIHGVDFKKGCYVGQEVVSRVQHRGAARKRIRKLQFADAAPPAGADIIAGDVQLGTVTAVSGSTGLGLIRIDRAAEAATAGSQTVASGEPVVIDLD